MTDDNLTQLQRIRLEAVALVLHKNPTLDDRYVAKKAEEIVDYIRNGYAEPNKEATNEAPDGSRDPYSETVDEEGKRRDFLIRAFMNGINETSSENFSGTPDYLLAEFLVEVLGAYDKIIVRRANWRGESVELPSLQSLREKLTGDEHPVAHLASYNHVGEKVNLCSNATPWQETPQGALVKLCPECRDINNG